MTIPLLHTTRLDFEQVATIRSLYAGGTKQAEIARQFGLSQGHISRIVRGDTYPSIPLAPRQCIDCKTLIDNAKRRCEPCSEQWKQTYQQQWYEPQRKRTGRYSTQVQYDTWEGVIAGYLVIDKQTGEKHGPYSRNHARYLVYKWNKKETTQ